MRNKQLMENTLVAVVFGFGLWAPGLWAEPPARGAEPGGGEATGSQREKPRKERPHDRKPPLADMSSEEREAVKKALQAVWGNPEVLQARDEVKRATEAFHQAIREAVGQQDPRVAELVERMHGGAKREDWDKRGPGFGDRAMAKGPVRNERGPRPPGAEGRGIAPTKFLAFHGDFSQEEKALLEKVREKAMASEEFKRVQGELKALWKEGEDLRRKRVQLFQQTREEITKAMIKVDPEVEPLLQRMQKRKRDR